MTKFSNKFKKPIFNTLLQKYFFQKIQLSNAKHHMGL